MVRRHGRQFAAGQQLRQLAADGLVERGQAEAVADQQCAAAREELAQRPADALVPGEGVEPLQVEEGKGLERLAGRIHRHALQAHAQRGLRPQAPQERGRRAGMHVPRAIVPELREDQFVGRMPLVEHAEELRPRLGARGLGIADRVGHQVDPQAGGRVDIIVDRLIEQRHLVVVPAAPEADRRDEAGDAAAHIDPLDLRGGDLRTARHRHRPRVGQHAEERMVERHRPQRLAGNEPGRQRPCRRQEVGRARDRVEHHHAAAQEVVLQQLYLLVGRPQRTHAAQEEHRRRLRIAVEGVERDGLRAVAEAEPAPRLTHELGEIIGTEVPVGDLARLAAGVAVLGRLTPDDLADQQRSLRLALALAAPDGRRGQRQRRHPLAAGNALGGRLRRQAQRHQPLVLVGQQPRTGEQPQRQQQRACAVPALADPVHRSDHGAPPEAWPVGGSACSRAAASL